MVNVTFRNSREETKICFMDRWIELEMGSYGSSYRPGVHRIFFPETKRSFQVSEETTNTVRPQYETTAP
jgi:hypothetical protein